MTRLFSLLLRLALLAVFTFGFVVLFEHGPSEFSEGARAEWKALLLFGGSLVFKRNDAPPPKTPESVGTPSQTPTAGSSSSSKINETTNRPVGGAPPAPR